MGKNVKIDILTKNDLQDAVLNNTYWGPGKNAPISKNRANWLVQNPRLNDGDYCLLVGLENDTMIAFVYMMPDVLNDENKTDVYWMIEWWVVPAYQNSVLSTYIFTEGMRLAGDNILIKFYAEHIKAFYDKQPFSELQTRMRQTIFFGLNPDLIIRKISFFRYIKPIIYWGDRLISSFYRYRNRRLVNKLNKDLSFDYINQIDTSLENWVLSKCNSDVIYKTVEYLNWQLSPEQYLTTPVFDKVYEKVQLRDYGPVMDLYNFTVIRNKEVIGFISFSNHGGEVYLKYFLGEEEHFDLNIAALIQHLIKLKVSHIFTDSEKVGQAISKKYNTTFVHQVKKVALVHNGIAEKAKPLTLKEQDGNFY